MTEEMTMAAGAALPIPEEATAARTTTEAPKEPGDDDDEEDDAVKDLAPLNVTYGTPARLGHLRDFEDDWDGDGAPKPSEEAILAAERILNEQPRVNPTLEGGVRLDWMHGIEITITADGMQELP